MSYHRKAAEAEIRFDTQDNEHGNPVEGVFAVCQVSEDESEFVFGTGGASIRRALANLTETCSCGVGWHEAGDTDRAVPPPKTKPKPKAEVRMPETEVVAKSPDDPASWEMRRVVRQLEYYGPRKWVEETLDLSLKVGTNHYAHKDGAAYIQVRAMSDEVIDDDIPF